MEKKEMGVTTEDADGSSSLSGYNGYPLLSNAFEFYEVEKSSVGFMELLGLQDYSSLLPLPSQQQVSTLEGPSPLKDLSDTAKEGSEVSNQQPTTPNSSSISSASSGAVTVNDEHNRNSDQPEEEHSKTNKLLKAKKTSQKRQREPRFAFMTKSEVDHLEDGYRWRKYGQKAVKNSPFPRSYYRCTTASCIVKKRVERSFNDPSIVVTTYEGQHTHPSPVMPRSHVAGIEASLPAGASAGYASSIGSLMAGNILSQYHHLPRQRQLVLNNSNSTLSSSGFPNNSNTTDSTSKNAAFAFVQDRKFCTSGATATFLRDHGLLQDIVPSHMLKEE